jgi:flagellar motor switch protein FliM
MFVSFFNVNFCGISRDVCFAVQLDTIEPFFEKLKPPVETQISNQTAIESSKSIWNSVFDDVPVFITANWDTLEMKAREISNLKIGDVITLNGDYSETIKLRIGGIEKFSGRLGTQNGKWAVELRRPIEQS